MIASSGVGYIKFTEEEKEEIKHVHTVWGYEINIMLSANKYQCSEWYMVYGAWRMVYGIWYMVCGIWYGIWYMVYGMWYMVYVIWYIVYGIWYMVYGI